MSNARSPRTVVGSPHPTRQQLDELDALLQRMLELPVKRDEEKAEEQSVGATSEGLSSNVLPQRSSPTPRLARTTPPASSPPPNRHASTPEPEGPPEGEAPTETESPPLAVQPPHRMHKRATRPQLPETEEGTVGADGEWVPFRSSWKPSPLTWPPLAESWAQAQKVNDTGRVRRDDPVVEPGVGEPPSKPDSQLVPPRQELENYSQRQGYNEKSSGSSPAGLQDFPNETLVYPRPPFGTASLDRTSRRPVSDNQSAQETANSDSGVPEDVLWPLRPMVWVNRTYEALVSWMGAPGQWLAGSGGKTLLGVVGLLCLVGASGLVLADWLGWTW